jgi:hypothetical protein
VLIDDAFLRLCAEKTREVEQHYERDCVFPSEAQDEGFPRSADDLHWIIAGIYEKPINHRLLPVDWRTARYRSFLVTYPDRYDIWYARGMSTSYLRYYKTKELLQIHLKLEALRTQDIVELVANMIKRASPTSIDLDLGHSTTADTLGEVAAMEFLFPLRRRAAHLSAVESNGIAQVAGKYGVPDFVVQSCFNNIEVLGKYFT